MSRLVLPLVLALSCSEGPPRLTGQTIVFTALPPVDAVEVDTNRPHHDALEGSWPAGLDEWQPLPRDPSPVVGANFVGLPFSAAGLPPDTMGAAGPNHLMVTLNSEVRVQTKTGTPISTVSLAAFWASTGATGPFDPSVVFHPGISRWLTIAVSNRRTAQASLLIGISQTSDPTGAWNLFRVDGDPGDTTWPDYPRLGFNGQYAVVAANMFGNPTGSAFVQSKVFVFSLADLQANVATPATHVAPFITMVPAHMLDPAATEVVLVATANTPGGIGLALPRLTGATAATTTLTPSTSAVRLASPAPYSFSVVPAPQLGSATRVDGLTFNSSETQSVVARNGRLYVAHQIGLPQTSPNRTSLQWWEIDLTQNQVIGVGRVDDSTGTRAYSHPSLAVNRAGDVILGYSRFGTDVYPSAAYAVHLSNDLPGSLRDEVIFKAGEAIYTRAAPTVIRWGDYSAASVDPVDDCTLWTLQEYAASPANTWGTWWAQVPMPDQPLTLRAPTLPSVAEDGPAGSVLVTALGRVVACNRPSAALVVTAIAQTANLQAVDAGVIALSRAPVSWALVANANGPAVVRATLADGTASTSLDLAFTITEVNDPPTASPDVVTLDEDVVTSTVVTANDLAGPPNEAGQVLRVTAVPATTLRGGVLAVDGGLVRYTPPADFSGTDSFTYTLTDDGTTNGVAAPLTAVGAVSLTVRAVNDPPRLVPVTGATLEDQTLLLPLAMSFSGTPGPPDESAQSLRVVSVVATSDAGGLVSLDGGLRYVPPPDFSGLDRLSITVEDDGAPTASATGVIDVTVTAVNDPPVGAEDVLTAVEDQPTFLSAALLLQNDDAGPLESTQGLQLLAIDSVTDGGSLVTLVDGGALVQWSGDFNGTDQLTYQLSDDGQPSLQASARVRLTVSEVNDPPTVVNDTVTASARQPLVIAVGTLTSNDRPGPANESSQALTISSVSASSQRGGAVTLQGTSITYVAPLGFSGTDSFTCLVQDDGTTSGSPDPRSAMAIVQVIVTDTNEPPVLAADQLTVREDTEVDFEVLANDRPGPAFESLQRLSLAQVPTMTERGGVLGQRDGGVHYTPPLDFHGVDRFTYRARDDGLTNGQPDPQEADATVTIEVLEVNDPPRAAADMVSATEGAALRLSVQELLSNDRPGPDDEAGQALRVVSVEGAALEGDAVVVDAKSAGALSFTYVVTDDGKTAGVADPRTATGEVLVTVAAKPRGCGCNTSEGAPALLTMLLVLVNRRRRR